MSPISILVISFIVSGSKVQDAASEAKAEIATKYSQYDRAINLNDAGKLLEFYSNETMENYVEETKQRLKRTRTEIQESLGRRIRTSNKALDVTRVKGHRTSIKQFRMGEGIAVVKTDEKTAVIRPETLKPGGRSPGRDKKVNEVTISTKMEIWYHTSNGWKLENTRVVKRAIVATYLNSKPQRK